MAEPVLKFGPEWLRALSQGAALPTPPPSPGLPKYKLADYRYGREEMLALLPKDIQMPSEMQQFDGLVRDILQQPMAFLPLSEEEQRMWSRSVNSEAVLRLTGRGTGSTLATPPRGGGVGVGRGVSVDRGRGRGRGNYFSRNMLLEDGNDTTPPVGFSRQRSYERSNSLNERGSWDERERRYDKSFVRDDDSLGVLRKDGSRNSDWRSSARDRDRDGDDDGGWRVTGSRSDKWGRGNWRDERSDRRTDYVPPGMDKHRGASYKRSHVRSGFWDEDYEGGGDGLPEWSTEDNKDAESVGTFDASGAFLETKGNQEEVLKNEENEDVNPVQNSQPDVSVPSFKEGAQDSSDADERSLSETSTGDKENKQEKECILPSPKSSRSSSKRSSPDLPPSSQSSECEQSPAVSVQVESTELEQKIDAKLVGKGEVIGLCEPEKTVKEAEIITTTTTSASISATSSEAPLPIDRKEEVNFEYLKKAAENLVDTWTAEEEEKIEVSHASNSSMAMWYYRDPQGLIQGPFSNIEMAEWYRTGYFDMSLLVRRGEEGRFCPLGELALQCGFVPFLPNVPHSAIPAPVQTSNSVLNGIMSTTAGIPLNHPSEMSATQDRHLRILHQQLLQQHFIQQQLIQQQQQLLLRQQLINGLKQSEGYSPSPPPLPTPQQQQHLMMQRLLVTQQQVPRLPAENGEVPDPLRQFAMMAAVQGKETASPWSLPPPTVASPRTNVPAEAGRWPLSVWDLESGPASSGSGQMVPSDNSLLEQQHVLLEEQKKKRLKEEELHRKQKQEKQIDEQRRRQAEKEEQMERERLRIEEIRRREEAAKEEWRRQEEIRLKREVEERKQKEEEMRQKQEVEQKRREAAAARLCEERVLEEKRLKELELMKQKQQRQLEKEKERQKQEEQRRLEKLRWQQQKEEEERRRCAEEEEKKKKELEKQLMQEQRKKQQEEALQKLQEKQKQKNQTSAWGTQVKSNSENMSLAKIQKMEEKKEQEEKAKRQLLQQQQLMLEKQQQQKLLQAAQQSKAGLTWANRSMVNSAPVKSLLEIQHEEVEKRAQQQKKEQTKKQTTSTPMMPTSVWNNASSHLLRQSMASTSVWNSNFPRPQENASSKGFWDTTVNSNPSNTPPPVVSKPANANKTKAAANQQVNPTANSLKSSNGQVSKSRQGRAKKEEEEVNVKKEALSKKDEFSQWCIQTLNKMQSPVDVPTFVAFLKDVDSPYEISDYVRSYLGDNKESRDFAKKFVEKRSEYRSKARKPVVENMWGPAPAINPNHSKPHQNADPDSLKGSGGAGGKKKKKTKMQKVDGASILGFTVHAANDRVNIGDIERIEDF